MAPEEEAREEAGSGTPSPPSTHHFVLVHGAGHGAWCWFKLRRLLEDAGHRVSCPDLLGAGIDRSDPNAILSFRDYNKPLLDLMSSLPENEKAVLVGHSAAGLSVNQATREFGHKVSVAIYVAATMLRSGFVTDQDLRDGAPDLSRYGDVLDLTFGSGPTKPPTVAYLRQQFQRDIFYQLSPKEDSTLASMLLRPMPMSAILGARFEGGEESVDSVRRVCVKTERDRALPPDHQEAMIGKWPPSEVASLDCDHSPFFSAPEELFRLLVDAADRAARAEATTTTDPACL